MPPSEKAALPKALYGMTSSEFERWFAVQVTPRHEQVVAAQLQYKGYQQFLPICVARRQWSDRTKVVQTPLFAGYVFCRTKRSRFGDILTTKGVLRVVSFGGHPSPIPDEEVCRLHQAIDSDRQPTAIPYTAVGQHAEVVQGPLSGITGIVTQIRNHHRLIMSVDLLLRSIAVEVQLSEVRWTTK